MPCSTIFPHVTKGWKRLNNEWNEPSACSRNTRYEKLSLHLVKRPIIVIAAIVYGAATPVLAGVDLIYTTMKGKKCSQFRATPEETAPLLPQKVVYKHGFEWSSLDELTLNEDIWNGLKPHKEKLIEGFLEIGEEEGGSEGGCASVGAYFTRLTFRESLIKNKEAYSNDWDILTRVDSALHRKVSGNPRAYYDDGDYGWSGHVISRMIGYLTSSPQSNGPFFEVLINSQRIDKRNDQTFPFSIYILFDKDYADSRCNILRGSKKDSGMDAMRVYYDKQLYTPKKYMLEEEKCQRLDPQTKQFLQGLDHLSKCKYEAQRIGNCWIKQPMLCILVGLYLELLTHRQYLSDEQCWQQAKTLYDRWKVFTVGQRIKKFVDTEDVPNHLKQIAQKRF